MHYLDRDADPIDKHKEICTNDRLVVLYTDYVFEKLIKLMTESECNIYRIPKPIDDFKVVLPLEEFSPFMNVFNHKYEVFLNCPIGNNSFSILIVSA